MKVESVYSKPSRDIGFQDRDCYDNLWTLIFAGFGLFCNAVEFSVLSSNIAHCYSELCEEFRFLKYCVLIKWLVKCSSTIKEKHILIRLLYSIQNFEKHYY